MVPAQAAMNEHGLYDVYGPIYIPFWQTPIFYYSMLTCALVALLIVVWFIVRRVRARNKVVPPWDRALQALAALKHNNCVTVEQGKIFYGALTCILKEYVYERYGLESSARTDDEFLGFVATQALPPELIADLQEIFSGVMIIKFANIRAMQDQIERDYARSIACIRRSSAQHSK